jgi:hypothetical protein
VVGVKKQIDAYSFEKISSRMAKRFGTIEKYLEGRFTQILLPIESNLLRASRKNGINSGKRVIEAVHICLFVIDGYLNQMEYDLDPYISDANKPFLTAFLMCFDPLTNEYLKPLAEEQCDLHSEEGLCDYFEAPVKCLLRIEKSVAVWTKERGGAGYFDFLENQIGKRITNNDKIECVIVKLKETGTLKDANLTFRDFFPDMDLQDMLRELFPTIFAIFKLGFIPAPDEICELTQEQYAAYRRQGGDMPEPLYTVIPKNYKYLGPSNALSLLEKEDTVKLGKAAIFLYQYAAESGCDSQESEDVLKFVAGRLPDYFSKGTKFERPRMKALEPGEVPLTAREEWVDLLAHVLGEGQKLSLKLTVKDAGNNIKKTESISIPIEKKR